MKKKLNLLLSLIVLTGLPNLVFAQFDVGSTPQPSNQGNYIIPSLLINNIFNYIIWPVLVGVVIVLFIAAGIKFFTAKGEPGELETARRFLIWGVIGTIIIVLSTSIVLTIKTLL